MARGLPAFWSTVAAIPFIASGIWLLMSNGTYPPTIGWAFVGFGLVVVALGSYVHVVAAPDPPSWGGGERVIVQTHPSQRVAAMKIGASVPFLLLGVYLLGFTMRPYYQPTLALGGGLYLAVTGLYTYWRNSLTTYYVTDHRVVRSYRFLSRLTKEVPFHKVRGVTERRSFAETLVGLGNVGVSTGTGDGLTVRLRNVERSQEVARLIRDQVMDHQQEPSRERAANQPTANEYRSANSR